MSYHPGICYWPQDFDYSPENIAKIPLVTIRKFGTTGWDERFYYVEGDRVRAFQDSGKRVIGTFTVGDNSQWATMSDADWARKVTLFMKEVPVHGVEVGNEIGAAQVPAYLSKLKIASEIIRGEGGWVMLSSPFPNGEARVWDAVAAGGGFAYCDQIAVHPYAKDPSLALAKVKGFRVRLSSLGVFKGMSLTEFGWATAGPSTNPFVVTEAVQAQYVAQAFRNWKANASSLGLHNTLYYTLNDGFGADYGVIRRDGSHKPSYVALEGA